MKFRNYLESIADIGIFPMISLLIFFVFFTLLTIWAVGASKEHINRIKQLPLNGTEPENNPNS